METSLAYSSKDKSFRICNRFAMKKFVNLTGILVIAAWIRVASVEDSVAKKATSVGYIRTMVFTASPSES